MKKLHRLHAPRDEQGLVPVVPMNPVVRLQRKRQRRQPLMPRAGDMKVRLARRDEPALGLVDAPGEKACAIKRHLRGLFEVPCALTDCPLAIG